MSDYEYRKGLDRGVRGASSADSLLDAVDPFCAPKDSAARSRGYRDGLAAKAMADAQVGADRSQPERSHSSSSSGGSSISFGFGENFGAAILVVCVLAGGLYGLVQGFIAHGVGGALLFGVLGAAAGGVAFFVAVVVGVWVLGLLALGAAFWLLQSLWDLGKPTPQPAIKSAPSTEIRRSSVEAPKPKVAPLDCVRPQPSHTAPWEQHTRILSSVPASDPPPVFLGNFSDSRIYSLSVWRDEHGAFGELSTPVLEADSPTAQLRSMTLDPSSGTVSFEAHFPEGVLKGAGTIQGDFRGNIQHGEQQINVILRKQPESHLVYRSRAHFNCAMHLFRRH